MSLANIFATGQAYVALSRARSLEGLELLDCNDDCVRVWGRGGEGRGGEGRAGQDRTGQDRAGDWAKGQGARQDVAVPWQYRVEPGTDRRSW